MPIYFLSGADRGSIIWHARIARAHAHWFSLDDALGHERRRPYLDHLEPGRFQQGPPHGFAPLEARHLDHHRQVVRRRVWMRVARGQDMIMH